MAEHIHFVTGKLAEHSLRSSLQQLSERFEFQWSLQVLPISVAALMSPDWIASRLQVPPETDRVIIPGYCHGDLTGLRESALAKVERGPRDLRRLAEHFGGVSARDDTYGDFDIEIIAEINHAPRLSLVEIIQTAQQLKEAGADWIDVGCDPGAIWSGASDCVKALRDAGHRVSIDSLNPVEIAAAVKAGAELVLSVNSTNLAAANDWGCEVVAIPDTPEDWDSLQRTVEQLEQNQVPFRIDPILSPIGTGFAASLGRYLRVRDEFPDAEIMMGVGNLTELTDADSAATNVLLLGFCQELGIRSVLTTQVISWAVTSVRELDLARRLVKYAVERGVPPKHIEPLLVLLRDKKPTVMGDQALAQLAKGLKDANYRLFAERGEIHLVSKQTHLHNQDPFALFAELQASEPDNLDASHAFYLGYEMCKALTALTLGKQYEQDESLDWGFLTVEENHHRLPRKSRAHHPPNPS